MLVLDLGYEKTSERTGIKPATLRQWAKRFAWKVSHSQQTVTSVTKPGDVLLDELAECERETRLGLARYSKRAAKSAEEASLRDAPYVHKAAQVAGIAFKWDAKEQQNNTVVNVAILGIQPADVQVQTLDVESECQDSGA